MIRKTLAIIALITGLAFVGIEIAAVVQLACCAPTRAPLGGG
jgi:hypothetical protein